MHTKSFGEVVIVSAYWVPGLSCTAGVDGLSVPLAEDLYVL